MDAKDKITFLIGSRECLEGVTREKTKTIFSEDTIGFLNAWSLEIKKTAVLYQMADLMTFGFWCRRAHLLQMKAQYVEKDSPVFRGKGLALHFAPSNIPTLFAYSLTASLLAGNPAVMRLPSVLDHGAALLLETLRSVLEEFPDWKKRICLIQYAHDREITEYLSSLCQVRIIWGGDRSVTEIQRSFLPEDAVDITFPDRKSLCILAADQVLVMEELEDLVTNFYNDTYLMDQNACSSPHLIYWLGNPDTVGKARNRFWSALADYLEKHDRIEAETAVKKWESALLAAVRIPGLKIEQRENAIILLKIKDPTKAIWEYTATGGFFYEAQGETTDELCPYITEKCQTITCCGVDINAVWSALRKGQVPGVTRIVPVGHALDFSLAWDGHDLIEEQIRQ